MRHKGGTEDELAMRKKHLAAKKECQQQSQPKHSSSRVFVKAFVGKTLNTVGESGTRFPRAIHLGATNALAQAANAPCIDQHH
jgi:hypothetical protein